MILLASGSPRRSEILTREEIPFHVWVPNIDEILDESKTCAEQAMDIAKEKAMAAFEKFPDETILAADTIVVLNEEIYGKPVSNSDAKRMLMSLNNNTHYVITAFCVIKDNEVITDYDQTEVTFNDCSNEEIDEYIASGEPMDRAGAYAIQEKGEFLAKSYKGDYDTIVGLPITKIRKYL